MTRRVEGKIALVTGGASRPGLGFAIAERLAQEGAHVILTDIDAKGAEQSAAIITEANLSAVAAAHDVASQDDWDRVIGDIMETHGRLDIVVNNAGILAVGEIGDDDAVEGLRRQYAINIEGCFIGTQAAPRIARTAA